MEVQSDEIWTGRSFSLKVSEREGNREELESSALPEGRITHEGLLRGVWRDGIHFVFFGALTLAEKGFLPSPSPPH